MEKYFNRTGAGYKKDGSRGGYKGKPSFGGKTGGFRRGAGDERPAMHPATCSECGASCEVPFIPNGKKPIFCRNCFQKQENDYGAERPRTFDKPAYRSTPRTAPAAPGFNAAAIERQLKALNEKMDAILAALMEPDEDEDEGEDEDEDEDEDEGDIENKRD